MRTVAPDVVLIELAPRNLVNAYLVGDVLVDAGLSFHADKILREIRASGIQVTKHVATHAHIDHVGGMSRVVASTQTPVLIGADARAFAETGDPPCPPAVDKLGLRCIARRLGRFRPFGIDGILTEGDEIGSGFVAIETPGHAPGHISLWRERDRTLIAGDVIAGHGLLSQPGVYEPPACFSTDVARNRESARRLAELEPETICFGHGPPLSVAAEPLRTFVDRVAA
jgi:glyoxylase-like metal-dependent hydrolase (beta-lactamase superfamily II)